MAGTIAGGKAAAQKNMELYGADYYRRIGSTGGRATGKKGFALNKDLARQVGSIGGRKSRRGASKKYEYKGQMLAVKTIAEKEGVRPSTILARLDRTGRTTLDA